MIIILIDTVIVWCAKVGFEFCFKFFALPVTQSKATVFIFSFNALVEPFPVTSLYSAVSIFGFVDIDVKMSMSSVIM
jgi:hypothetical protein